MKITDPYYVALAYRGDWVHGRRHRSALKRRGDLAARIRAHLAEQDEPQMSDDLLARVAAVFRSA